MRDTHRPHASARGGSARIGAHERHNRPHASAHGRRANLSMDTEPPTDDSASGAAWEQRRMPHLSVECARSVMASSSLRAAVERAAVVRAAAARALGPPPAQCRSDSFGCTPVPTRRSGRPPNDAALRRGRHIPL
eukprot:3202174-Prymnesium_polylepis.1